MNSIYNEIYGLYYFMLDKILEKSLNSYITLDDINQIVSKYGFSESSLYFTPKVIDQYNGYSLLQKSDGSYTSILKNKPVKILTEMQRRFIKSMICDKKIRLFFEDDLLDELNKAFSDVEPLINFDDIVFTETALDSDDYMDKKYIADFKLILNSIKNNKAMRICFNTSGGERKTMKLIPYKLEYGIMEDKFRLCGVNVIHEKPKKYVKINIARILTITVLNQSFDIDFQYFIEAKKSPSL